MHTELRLLRPADLPQLMRLSMTAGWNQTENDWRRLLGLEPEGCFGIECGGVLASSATALCYGRELAWIGMVLTLPEFRRRGFASRLMERCLSFIAGRRVGWIKLDATEQGRPVYARYGFRDESIVERWMRPGTRRTAHGDPEPRLPFDPELDREAFGADRRRLIEGLGHHRPGCHSHYLGPIVSRSVADARRVAAWVVNHYGEGSIAWDVPADNAAAVSLAGELGFAPTRRLVRMACRGTSAPPLPVRNDLVFALAGFELG